MINSTMALLAFGLDFTSVVMNQVSFALQKCVHREQEDMQPGDVKKNKSVFCTGKGSLGIVLMVLAALLHIFAVAHADLTLLSCNASTGIIANVVISTRYLGERFDARYDLQGLTMIAIGCTGIVLLSNKEKQELNLSQLIELLIQTKSILYLCLATIVVNAVKITTPLMLKKLRKFEKDCEQWQGESQNRILPDKEGGERSERVLIEVLNGLQVENIQEVSPQSVDLKRWLKVPLLLLVTGAAMLVSLSDLQFKLIGAIVEAAQDIPDYLCLVPLAGGVAFTASQTLVLLNQGMKYYNQMEVMPIYQTSIMCWSIVVGMTCFNEIQFYSQERVAGICLAALSCVVGISFLLQKSKEKSF